MQTNKIILLVSIGCFTIVVIFGLGGWLVWKRFRPTASTSNPQQAQQTAAGEPEKLRANAFDPVAAYDQQCKADDEEPSLECGWLKGMVVAEVLEALEQTERSRDQRGASEAMEALDLDDEPEIQVAACRVLALFPYDTAATPKLTHMMFSPYTQVQSMAAVLLTRDPDQKMGGLGYQYNERHRSNPSSSPYEEKQFPPSYAKLGFPEYPGAVHFPPGDSDRSIGWATTDSASDAESKLSQMLNVKSIGYQEWNDRSQQVYAKGAPSIDPSAMEEIQKLSEEYAKTQDPKIIQKMEELQKKMSEPAEKAGKIMENLVNNVSNPRLGLDANTMRYFIAEEKEGRISKLIAVYPDPAIQQTVIEMMWDLNDYEPAWKSD